MRVEILEETPSPAIVYFWGPVRDHVNRVAAEYAARLPSPPVWVNVGARRNDAAQAPDVLPLAGARVFELEAGAEPKFLTAPSESPTNEGTTAAADAEGESRPRVVLRFPPVGPVALRAVADDGPSSAFVLSNIDRLEDPGQLLDPGTGSPILGACRERGVVLVLTSEGLLPMPHAESECAVEVVSMPEEEWWEADVRPGVPYYAAPGGSGTSAEGYAKDFPELRPANPLMAKWAGQPVRVTDPADVYPNG
ncbi:MAG TPA: hypothetical protein VGS23_02105, partial [Thermoplasmata archaeon]|nr:hypothetical protein [Thermoplasmata archaeon]